MLYELHLNHIAVVKEAEIEPSCSFNVMTGQTGAGKSVIIGSIELLLGNKADPSIIRSGQSTATVTALFGGLSEAARNACTDAGYEPDSDGLLLISRTVSAEGRPNIKINGRTATASVLRQIVPMLLNIHGQRDTQALLDQSKHLAFLDRYADTSDALTAYGEAYGEMCEYRRELERIKNDARDIAERRDLFKMQLDEISAVKLKEGEEEKLLAERNKLRSSELIQKQAGFAYRALKGGEKGNVILLLEKTQSALESLSEALPQTDELAKRVESCRYEIEDIAESIYDISDIGEGDPTERLNRVESRLDRIERIKRKYGPEISDVLRRESQIKEKLDLFDNTEAAISDAERKVAEGYAKTLEAGKTLSKLRRAGAQRLDSAVASLLAYLDMPKVRFESCFEDSEPGKNGIDTMQFCIAANPGEPMTPLAKTASGGETSRVMLALKCVLADSDGISTMIFDEIDSGVSGGTARKIGLLLSELSKKIQIIAVTHSAQIASLADTQFAIIKNEVDGRSESSVTRLDEEGRVEEIARILGGIHVTELQRDAARQLMRREDAETK